MFNINENFQPLQPKAELEELDHEISEEISEGCESYYGEIGTSDEVSEWHSFFTRNLELLAKIADLLPDQIFTLVVGIVWLSSSFLIFMCKNVHVILCVNSCNPSYVTFYELLLARFYKWFSSITVKVHETYFQGTL